MQSLEKLQSVHLVNAVFSNEGPRGGWRETEYILSENSTMTKCLAAGRFGLMQYQKELDEFLTKCGLPKTNYIEQEEFETTKSYLVLTLEKNKWNEMILPILKVFEIARQTLIPK